MARKKAAAPVGRPTRYRAEFAEQARKLCRLGATDVELAEFFEVAASTVGKWKNDHPEFSESIKAGKILSDAEVADKLFHRALGYSHEAEKIMVVAGQVERVPYVEHYPPDTAAAIFWLKNRQRGRWRDKPQDAADDDTPPTPVKVTVNVQDARKRGDDAEP